MNKKGQKHWNSAYPGPERMKLDLEGGSIYLIKDKGVCKGMITLNDREPEDYNQVAFLSGRKKPLYLQHLAVHPKWQGQGIGRQMIEYAQRLAKEKGFDALRIDVFTPSESARQFCEKQSFKEVALFQAAYQKVPFICYEKLL